MVIQVSPPSWAEGITCPSLDGLDPIKEAEALLAKTQSSMRKGDAIRILVVDEVFALMQLAVDDRPIGCRTPSPTSEEKAFRGRLAQKTRDLSRELATILQPREIEKEEQDGDGDARATVVLAAQHYSAMAHVMMARSNTGALLIAHNGLAKLLATRLPWLIGGVLDAPRLLSQLSRICRDGLDQLQTQLSGADVGLASGAEEAKQANKFGKLLANFCTLMAGLLRHLGPECPPPERRRAYGILTKTVATVYPGVVAIRRARRKASLSAADSSAVSSLPAVVAGRLYPQTKEAFLSICGRPPCFSQRAASDSCGQTPGTSDDTCQCFETRDFAEKGEKVGLPSQREHDAWEPLEALRPARTPPGTSPRRMSDASKASGAKAPVNMECGGEKEGDRLPGVEPVGAILLLCEVLRSEGKLSRAVASRLLECCAWVMDHLAYLFPSWVEAATEEAGQNQGAKGSAGGDAFGEEAMAAVLCVEVGDALGSFVARRAVVEDFEEAQVQLVEGCACHPHPLCREIWVKAFKAFLRKCDPTAQASCVRTFSDAALDPRLGSRRRRRLARALSACTAPGVLDSTVSDRLRHLLLSRLREEHELKPEGDNAPAAEASEFPRDPAFVDFSSRSARGSKGACVLELLSGLLRRPFVGDDKELRVSSTALARSAMLAELRDTGEEYCALGAGDNRFSRKRGQAESLAAAAKFLAASLGWTILANGGGTSVDGRSFNATEEAARVAERALELALAGEASAAATAVQLRQCPLAAIISFLVKLDPGRLPRLCSLMTESAEEGGVHGEELLALAEGLSSMGRQPFPSKPVDAAIWEATLKNGFALLFGCGLWPVATAAMQALEEMARHADPRTAKLLPRLVPGSRLASFKARLSRRAMTLDGGRPIELDRLRERAWTEWRFLASAASSLAEETTRRSSRGREGASDHPSGRDRQVVLRKGGNLSAVAGLLSSTIVDIELQNDQTGGGVRITLRAE